jgi:hypothetical protein
MADVGELPNGTSMRPELVLMISRNPGFFQVRMLACSARLPMLATKSLRLVPATVWY